MNLRTRQGPGTRVRVRKGAAIARREEAESSHDARADDRLNDLTNRCIRCGFCLAACPTFQLTGAETESPRGRIGLVRAAMEGELAWRRDAGPHLDACLGCRACETECPSGVRYGEIFEIAKGHLAAERGSWALRPLLGVLSRPRLFRLCLGLVRGVSRGHRFPWSLRLEIPPPAQPWKFPPLDPSGLPEVKGRAILLEGCVMAVLYPHVHLATRRLLRRIGLETTIVTGCCGALHLHGGFRRKTHRLAQGLARSVPPDGVIVVNSAGCGSVMKEYGSHLDPSFEPFSRRVRDLSEVLVDGGLSDLLRHTGGVPVSATYHDPCHLVHAQGIHDQPRALLASVPGLTLAPLPEATTCCGSAGIFNITHPTTARQLLARKMQNVVRTGASLLVTANPGCHAWMAQGTRDTRSASDEPIEVRHLAEVLEAAFQSPPDAPWKTTASPIT